jgi:galactokinase
MLNLSPIPELIRRMKSELSSEFREDLPIRISRAPGRLDVMGGIADYTGSMVCEATLDRAAAVALQNRDDRELQIFSLNLKDEQREFTFRLSLQSLAEKSSGELREEFSGSGRKWAGYLAGCLAILHQHKWVDLNNPAIRGMNLALLSNVPLGAGVSSSAAIEVAAMMAFIDQLNIREKIGDPMKVAAMCQEVENSIVGAPCGIMDQVSSCAGESGSLLRMICQPHNLLPPLHLPERIRVIGINSHVKHSVSGGMYGKTRCAAFMGHRMILEKMREMGTAAGMAMLSDPMHGYLANLDPDDYKRHFRPHLPKEMSGRAFLDKFGSTVDTATHVEPDVNYHVLSATDHHVLEARRVRNFVNFLESAEKLPVGKINRDGSYLFPSAGMERKKLLDKAGHLMYASHLSYTNDALLGADECDVLVDLVWQNEPDGFYGAKITGGGSGGTVAVLADEGERTDSAIAQIMSEYEKRTGQKPEAFLGTSPGAWTVGTVVI